MKKLMRKLMFVWAVVFMSLTAKAHEGMWIPSLLKAIEGDMQAMGLKLSAEDIYSINNSSLKDAIVHFGGGCTAEIVSNKGLILTNHHCGLSQIQSHSSVENDYVKNGFWAMNASEELKNPGLTATILDRIEDVTQKVLKGTSGLTGAELDKMKAENIKSIVADASKENLEATVKPFYYGNAYYLIVSKTFKDVRLVGAPPSGIGKFGGDTDNWIWPRHTGDFSVFRIYANDKNEPAEVSDNNKPYRPEQWLKVSMEGVEEGDFTMVFGYPGRTSQYLTSYEVEDYINVINPKRIAMRTASLDIIDLAMGGSDKVRIQYTSKQARISNAHKKWIGQNIGLKEKGALQKKKDQEAEYLKRAPRDGKYKNLLQDLKSNQEAFIKYDLARSQFIEIWYYGPEVLRYSYNFGGLLNPEMSNDKFNIDVAKKKNGVAGFFKNYDVNVDKAIYKKLLGMYVESLDHSLRPEVGELDEKTIDDLYEKSYFTSEEKLNKLLSMPQKKLVKKLVKDPIFLVTQELMNTFRGEVAQMHSVLSSQKDDLMKKYLAAQMEYFPEKTFFADANSTLRLTYGKIEGTYPRDGMGYTYYTTIDGIVQKNNTGEKDFEVPARLLELYEKKDYGKYTTNGELRVCLLGSNHTTGGNSGSPALNGEGHLIGINFDRSWESTMSDIMFDPSICRNIMVDIKYVLWVMDKYAGAGYLVDEMELVDATYRDKVSHKEFKNRIEQYDARLRDVPNDKFALYGRALANEERGNGKAFLDDINAALKLDPNFTSAINAKASFLESVMEFDEAMKLTKKSIQIEETSEAHFINGLCLMQLEKYKEAIASFNKVIAIDYTSSKAYYNRGVCHSSLGDVDEACRNFELAKNIGDEKAAKMYHLNCEFGAW